jgi:hypothetical protein
MVAWSQATPPASALSKLNAQRAANGLSPVTLNTQWSTACAAHDRYLHLNPGAYQAGAHTEDPSKPGYTAAGAAISQQSEMAAVDTWDSVGPFENAPLHLQTLLSPRLSVIGYDASYGYMCVAVPDEQQNSAANVFFTYPGNGVQNVPTSETIFENPDPNKLLGISSPTGPYLLVFTDGPWVPANQSLLVKRASLISLTGGAVELKVVDGTGPLADYLDVGVAFLIPVHPLSPGTTYTASVTGTFGADTLTHSWTFTTVGDSSGSGGNNGGGVPAASAKLTALSLSRRAPTRDQVPGTTVSYTLSAQSSFIAFELTQLQRGYKVNHQCFGPGYKSLYPRAPACQFWGTVKSLMPKDVGQVGTHRFKLSLLLKKLRLGPGNYRLRATAEGNTKLVAFRVRR